MTKDDFERLGPGDVVRHVESPHAFVVTDEQHDGEVRIVRTATMTNPSEWILVGKNELNDDK